MKLIMENWRKFINEQKGDPAFDRHVPYEEPESTEKFDHTEMEGDPAYDRAAYTGQYRMEEEDLLKIFKAVGNEIIDLAGMFSDPSGQFTGRDASGRLLPLSLNRAKTAYQHFEKAKDPWDKFNRGIDWIMWNASNLPVIGGAFAVSMKTGQKINMATSRLATSIEKLVDQSPKVTYFTNELGTLGSKAIIKADDITTGGQTIGKKMSQHLDDTADYSSKVARSGQIPVSISRNASKHERTRALLSSPQFMKDLAVNLGKPGDVTKYDYYMHVTSGNSSSAASLAKARQNQRSIEAHGIGAPVTGMSRHDPDVYKVRHTYDKISEKGDSLEILAKRIAGASAYATPNYFANIFRVPAGVKPGHKSIIRPAGPGQEVKFKQAHGATKRSRSDRAAINAQGGNISHFIPPEHIVAVIDNTSQSAVSYKPNAFR